MLILGSYNVDDQSKWAVTAGYPAGAGQYTKLHPSVRDPHHNDYCPQHKSARVKKYKTMLIGSAL